jgi:hypothetical protein
MAAAPESPSTAKARPKGTKSVEIRIRIKRLKETVRERSAEAHGAALELLRRLRITHRESVLNAAVREILDEAEFAHAVEAYDAWPFALGALRADSVRLTEQYQRKWEKFLETVGTSLLAALCISLMAFVFFESVWQQWHVARAKRSGLGGGFLNGVQELWSQHDVPSRFLAALALLGLFTLAAWLLVALWKILRAEHRENWDEFLATVRPAARLAINTLANDESPPLLRLEEAPSLSSIADAEYRVPRPADKRISTLINELGAAAVAISGPRGAGKTTLLRSLRDQKETASNFVVSVEAPASYNARDFTIMLYKEFCGEVLKHIGQPRSAVAQRTFDWIRIAARLILFGVMASIILGALSKAVRVALQPYIRLLPLGKPIVVAAWVAGLFTIWVVLGLLRRRETRDMIEMYSKAASTMRRLQYLQNVSVERSASLKVKGSLDLGAKSTRQMIEQSSALPDLVQSYRRFAGEAVEWWERHTARISFENSLGEAASSGHIIVAIDELDRISDSESAERFINEIKGIFGVSGCTYLVTVSEDAIALFERRMVGIRPALDSTFDEVLRLDILRFVDSYQLLSRRLVGFPESFAGLCHALSGGIPRELVRSARALIDAKRETESQELPNLARKLVQVEIGRLKSGFIPRLNVNDGAGHSETLLSLLADDAWPGRTGRAIYDAALQVFREGIKVGGRDGLTARQLAVSMLYFATIAQTFGSLRFIANADKVLVKNISEQLAAVRSVMPTSTDLARVRLVEMRQNLGLPVD